MTCKDFADFVSGHLEGQLDADTQARFDGHLAIRPDCVRYLEQYRVTVRAGQIAYDDELPPDVPDDLVRGVLDARKTPRLGVFAKDIVSWS